MKERIEGYEVEHLLAFAHKWYLFVPLGVVVAVFVYIIITGGQPLPASHQLIAGGAVVVLLLYRFLVLRQYDSQTIIVWQHEKRAVAMEQGGYYWRQHGGAAYSYAEEIIEVEAYSSHEPFFRLDLNCKLLGTVSSLLIFLAMYPAGRSRLALPSIPTWRKYNEAAVLLRRGELSDQVRDVLKNLVGHYTLSELEKISNSLKPEGYPFFTVLRQMGLRCERLRVTPSS